jgi:hypothetical protein
VDVAANQGPTTKIDVPSPASDDLYPFDLTAFNGKLYFTGNDVNVQNQSPGRGLFVYDPVTNQASEIINSSVLGVDAQYRPSWYGDPFYNQINMTVFNNNLYFSGTQPVGGQGVPNLWQTDATLNSHGQATPTLVAVGGVGAGLQPCSLTTGDL